MTKENQNKQNGKPEDTFDAAFRQAHEAYDKQAFTMDESEIEAAFQRVAEKANIKHSPEHYLTFWKMAAAAIIIIGLIGIAFMVKPQGVRVPDGQIKTINLADGSSVTLNGGATLVHRGWFGWWGRTVALHGEAFFNVAHTGTPFHIKAGSARITVTGTKFNVHSPITNAGGKTSVFLKKGRVKLSSAGHEKQAVTLTPGEYSWVSSKQTTPIQPKKIDSSKATAWMHQGLSFTDQPLSAIFKKLKQRFGIKIKAHPNSLAGEKLTIYFSKVKDAEQTIADICRAKGWEYTKKGKTFIISESL
jgi:ferric-dicitrate binding protein FerR (iron transport regulator)